MQIAPIRIQNELKEIQSNPPTRWKVHTGSNWNEWIVWITAEPTSPFHTIPMKLFVRFSENYPLTPPKIDLDNYKIFFHPNIGYDSICQKTLSEKSPCTTVRQRINAFVALLSTPNPDSPLNSTAAKLYKQDPPGYFRKALMIYRGIQKK